MTVTKVETFKASVTVRTQLASLSRQLNMDKSKVIRLAIAKMHSEMSGEEEGT